MEEKREHGNEEWSSVHANLIKAHSYILACTNFRRIDNFDQFKILFSPKKWVATPKRAQPTGEIDFLRRLFQTNAAVAQGTANCPKPSTIFRCIRPQGSQLLIGLNISSEGLKDLCAGRRQVRSVAERLKPQGKPFF